VLRTNTGLNPLATMLRNKQLWTVERIFRTDKHPFATRPIFHKLDETIRGHVFCSFLALVLKIELESRIAALGESASWPAILADLDALTTPRRQPGAAGRRRRPAAHPSPDRCRLSQPKPSCHAAAAAEISAPDQLLSIRHCRRWVRC
jgi:hypothetical protein